MSLPILSGTGRLVDDPELRFTPSGKAVAKMRIAFSDRKKTDAGEWVDGDKLFVDVSVWDQEAEHVAESLQRGHEVLVSGKFRQREYTTREGEKRVAYELVFATVAPTLKYATAKVQKMARSGGGQQAQSAQRGGAEDPWSTGSAQTGAGKPSEFDDQPPF